MALKILEWAIFGLAFLGSIEGGGKEKSCKYRMNFYFPIVFILKVQMVFYVFCGVRNSLGTCDDYNNVGFSFFQSLLLT